MKLYHFTTKENAVSILELGILMGKTPYQDLLDFPAVSLSSLPNSDGLGLIRGETLIESRDKEFRAAANHYPMGVTKTKGGNTQVSMFDQSEVMLVVDLNARSSKLFSHQKLFDKILRKNVMADRSKSELAYWNAAIIHSTDHPFGTSHLSQSEIEQGRKQMLKSNALRRADRWFFYTDVIPVKKIVEVYEKNEDGEYRQMELASAYRASESIFQKSNKVAT